GKSAPPGHVPSGQLESVAPFPQDGAAGTKLSLERYGTSAILRRHRLGLCPLFLRDNLPCAGPVESAGDTGRAARADEFAPRDRRRPAAAVLAGALERGLLLPPGHLPSYRLSRPAQIHPD